MREVLRDRKSLKQNTYLLVTTKEMTEVLSFNFDCPKLRFDLSQVTGMALPASVSEVNSWFKVAHQSHESSESINVDSEENETYDATEDVIDDMDRLRGASGSPTLSSSKSGTRKRGRDATESRCSISDDDPPARKMKNVNGLAVKPYYQRSDVISMNPARLAEKFHRQRVKNNLTAINNANVQVLPETKKVQANAKVSTQAEIAKENAQAKQRLNAEKEKKRKEAEAAAQIQKANRIPKHKVKKTHSVMAVRKWEAKSGKQYALLSGPERDVANQEISRM